MNPIPKLKAVTQAVCEEFGITEKQILSKSKLRYIAEPRMIAMALSLKCTRYATYEAIAKFFKRHHTMVFYSVHRVESISSLEPEFAESVERIKSKLNNNKGTKCVDFAR